MKVKVTAKNLVKITVSQDQANTLDRILESVRVGAPVSAAGVQFIEEYLAMVPTFTDEVVGG